MAKVAILVWVMLGVVFAGAAVTVILAMPEFSGRELKLIPMAAIIGYVIALPISFGIARMIVRRAA